MARILISVRSEDFLVDCYLFRRGHNPTQLDVSQLEYNKQTNSLHLVPNQTYPLALSAANSSESPISDSTEKCVFNRSPHLYSTAPTCSDFTLDNDDRIDDASDCCRGGVDHISKTPAVMVPTVMYPIRQTCLLLDSHLVSLLMDRVRFSPKFKKRFIKFVQSNIGFSHRPANIILDQSHTTVPYFIDIVLQYPKQYIDYSWHCKMQHLVEMKLRMDEAMAILSTLGGGYSALGEYYENHSLEAFNIAVKQLQIALKSTDPLSVSRCYLYIALSLMQRGYLHCSRAIIRKQFSFAKNHMIQDGRLISMCHGLWAKLGFLYHLRNMKKKGLQYSTDTEMDNVLSSPSTYPNQNCCKIQLAPCSS
ncbi:Hypothetical predicted protein [Octopus vulgaris]|uniref:Uncharacterized protein n=1 Tax=Octopus vulgaris TaxID=6645 RepID=A0AA36AGS2_OCTVU|nr:Hypothetical predicted protein [Octopus vulgaris]